MFWLRNKKIIFSYALLSGGVTCAKPHLNAHVDAYSGARGQIQEVFHVYLNKFEIVVSHLFFIIFSNDQLTLVNLICRNKQPPRQYLLTLCAGLKRSLKMSSQNLSV